LKKELKIFFVAGESSGDLHGSSLVKSLKEINPQIKFKAIGGDRMSSEGAELLFHIKEVNYIGFSSVMKNIRKIKSILNKTEKEILNFNPDALVLIDFPGFNLKLASELRKNFKGKIIYYISPQLWAWHESRVNTIRKNVDLMLVTFPFETEFYKKHSVESIYVGNPLVNRIDDFLQKNKRESSIKKVISFMPGSRKDEVDKMMQVMLDAASKFKEKFDCNINFICSTNLPVRYYEKKIHDNDFKIIYDEENSDLNYRTILNSDLVVSKSGTSSMECALIGTPFLVCYKAGKLNYFIAKMMIKVKHIAMINIILGKEAVKEFIQSEMTANNLFNEGNRILSNDKYRKKMIDDFKLLREKFSSVDASEKAAGIILSSIQ
jgi:lipid-A-disaccharide synthase